MPGTRCGAARGRWWSAYRENATGEKKTKRGGRRLEHARSQNDYGLPLESAQEKAEHGDAETIAFLSKLVIAIGWQDRQEEFADMEKLE